MFIICVVLAIRLTQNGDDETPPVTPTPTGPLRVASNHIFRIRHQPTGGYLTTVDGELQLSNANSADELLFTKYDTSGDPEQPTVQFRTTINDQTWAFGDAETPVTIESSPDLSDFTWVLNTFDSPPNEPPLGYGETESVVFRFIDNTT